MASPEEIERAAGIEPVDEIERKRIWAAAQAFAADSGRAPSAEDLALAERILGAAQAIQEEHLAGGQGRAVITLTDAEEGVDVAMQFTPDLEEVSEDEVAGTPAQVLALELAQGLLEQEEGEHGDDGHDHPH